MEENVKPKPPGLTTRLINLAYSPVKLRVLLAALMLGGWYGGYAMPTGTEIDESTKQVERERKRLGLAKDIEKLRKQVARFQDRIPKGVDPNEWLQYMLAGSRNFELKIASIDTGTPKAAGPYKAVVIRMELEGSLKEVESFLRWIESNHRLLRIDSIALTPRKDAKSGRNGMGASLVILGLVA